MAEEKKEKDDGHCHGPCREGIFIRCAHYFPWLTDYTTRTKCFCDGNKYTELSKWR
jgi:hypothetical protein